MNDDLNLLITFYSTSQEMIKIAINVEHGMNIEAWEGFEYFREPKIEALILNEMPMNVRSFCKRILSVETIFDIKGRG
mgnify:CR=1 FL=1